MTAIETHAGLATILVWLSYSHLTGKLGEPIQFGVET